MFANFFKKNIISRSTTKNVFPSAMVYNMYDIS